MRTKQDVDILVALIQSNEPITSYQIAKDTGISLPQVRYRLPKLIQSEIVILVDCDGKELYEAHSVLSSRSTIDAITEHLVSISDIIDGYELSTPVCVKSIISFIVDRTVIK